MSAGTGFRAFQREFAERLKASRGASSQNGLAKELDYSQQMISRYESGRVPKCFLLLARLAQRKHVDVAWLLTGGVQPPSSATASRERPAPQGLRRVGPSPGAAEDVGALAAVSEELSPELYEGYETEAVITLLRLWLQASGSLRARLADRMRSVVLWWRFREPELADDLAALESAVKVDDLSFRDVVQRLAERFRSNEASDSQRRAITLYRFLLVIYEEHGLEYDRAAASIRLGQLHRKLSEWQKAKHYYTSGVHLAEALDDPFLLEEAWAGLGNLAGGLTDLASARSCYRRELAAAMRTGEPKLRLRTYVSLSRVAAESKQNLEEGLEYADRGLALCDELADEEFRSELLINRGGIVGQLGRRDEARALYEEAVRRAPSTKAARLNAIAYHNSAELLLGAGDGKQALELLALAERWCEQAQLPHVRCSILMNRARALLRSGLLRDAVRSSRQAVHIAERHGLDGFQAEARSLNEQIEDSVPAMMKIA